jgi:hypothetical protein
MVVEFQVLNVVSQDLMNRDAAWRIGIRSLSIRPIGAMRGRALTIAIAFAACACASRCDEFRTQQSWYTRVTSPTSDNMAFPHHT